MVERLYLWIQNRWVSRQLVHVCSGMQRLSGHGSGSRMQWKATSLGDTTAGLRMQWNATFLGGTTVVHGCSRLQRLSVTDTLERPGLSIK